MANIFISYATPDEGFVRDLAARLEEAGHVVFFSGGSLTAGAKWQDAISQSLSTADEVAIVVSEASSQSQWLMAEVGAETRTIMKRRPIASGSRRIRLALAGAIWDWAHSSEA